MIETEMLMTLSHWVVVRMFFADLSGCQRRNEASIYSGLSGFFLCFARFHSIRVFRRPGGWYFLGHLLLDFRLLLVACESDLSVFWIPHYFSEQRYLIEKISEWPTPLACLEIAVLQTQCAKQWQTQGIKQQQTFIFSHCFFNFSTHVFDIIFFFKALNDCYCW